MCARKRGGDRYQLFVERDTEYLYKELGDDDLQYVYHQAKLFEFTGLKVVILCEDVCLYETGGVNRVG
jgi:hypothetical protein